jgi:hypothetical protein
VSSCASAACSGGAGVISRYLEENFERLQVIVPKLVQVQLPAYAHQQAGFLQKLALQPLF